MADLPAEWATDALEILGEIPKAVTVKNVPGGTPVPLNALMSQPAIMQDLETGGFTSSTSFDVKFLRSGLVDHPGLVAHGNIITYNGEQFRIMTVTDRPPSAWVICKVQTLVQ
jgi:hypothetical protein